MNIMNFNELWNILEKEIPKRIANNKGLNNFAINRSKFEGWLKVEICDILSEHMPSITPEKDTIDIVADTWALELKTPNTSYRHLNVINKIRPITNNIVSIIEDIDSLKNNSSYPNRAVVFVAFPLSLKENSKDWNSHIIKISSRLAQFKQKEFTFENGVSAVLYFGWV